MNPIECQRRGCTNSGEVSEMMDLSAGPMESVERYEESPESTLGDEVFVCKECHSEFLEPSTPSVPNKFIQTEKDS